MANTGSFVQFPHPGDECGPGPDGQKEWSKITNRHSRKFMEFHGKWMDEDYIERCGTLRAWGEWEAESELLCKLIQPCPDSLYPRSLWQPYYVSRTNYRRLLNTDPFVFGDRFLYSNCRQLNSHGLSSLARGSVIAFGSGKKIAGEWNWLLDTVFVVADSLVYTAPEARTVLANIVPKAFLIVTAGPIADNLEGSYRLYMGATPDDPVEGMFSFFPAIEAHGEAGFPQPPIKLPREFLNPRNYRAPKGQSRQRTREELCALWQSLVCQVREAGLLIGTHAALPQLRSA